MQVPWPVVAKNAPRSASVHPHIVNISIFNNFVNLADGILIAASPMKP